MAKKDFNIFPVVIDQLPIVKPLVYRKALGNGQSDLVANALCDVLTFFETNQFIKYSPSDLLRLDEYISLVFSIVCDARFNPSEAATRRMIACNHLLSNLVATSSYSTTDGPLKHVLRQGDNLSKILFLHNPRNLFRLSPKMFFDVSPELASMWYTTYLISTSNPTEVLQRNLLGHLRDMDDRWIPSNPNVSCMYFTTTYLAPEHDRKVKGLINAGCKKRLDIKVKNTPNPKSIAVFTSKWHRNHAVYKSAGPLVDQLHKKYDVTLVHLGDSAPANLVTENFVKVVNAKFKGFNLALPSEVMDNNFAAIYYPDIGMNDESVWLSNHRLAPVQAMGYGHPATSGDNSEIDYFIGGTIERDVYDRYSEQMVLIPGLAQSPVWPSATRKHNWEPSDKVRINCVWGPDKYNHTMLKLLREISRLSTREHVWRFFPSPGINRYGGLVPFVSAIKAMLPNSEVISDKEYFDYMEEAEKGDFAVNSFPFGGYNTVIESLFLGVPMVALEGDRFYNRAASEVLRKIGMEHLSSKTVKGFVEICTILINDPESLTAARHELAECDLRTELFEDNNDYFLQAFDYILSSPPKSDKPIIIGETNG